MEIVKGDRDDLLPPYLKLRMVTSREERVAGFALDEITDVRDAIKYMKSYGLPEYSCVRLLKILDDYNGPLDGELLSYALDAEVFVKSYKKKGLAGGEKFLSRLSEKRSPFDSGVKMEIDEDECVITLDQPPTVADVPYDRRQCRAMSTDKVLRSIEELLMNRSPPSSDAILALSRAQEDPSIAHAVIALLRRKPSLLANEEIISCLLLAVKDLALKDTTVKNDLTSFSSFVGKKPSVAESVKELLRSIEKAGDTTALEDTTQKSMATTKQDATDVLQQLVASSVSDAKRGVLIQEFLCQCPELIPPDQEEAETLYSPSMYRVIGILFSKSVPAFDYIISLMPVRCSPKTISRIISRLLESHNTSLSSKLIIAAVISSLHLAHPFPLTRGHCAVLVEFILDELQRDYSTMSRMTAFLDELAKHHEDLVCVLFSTFSEILTSSVPGVRKRLVKQLVIKFRKIYPDVTVENDVISVESLSTVKDLDGFVRSLFIDLFLATAENSELIVDEKITAIKQFASCRPHLLIRHLALISGLLSSVVWLSTKELKNKYQKVLVLIPELLLLFSPRVFDEPQHVKAILQHYFYFFEKVGRSRIWNTLAVTIMQVCEHFLRIKAKDARPYLVLNQEVIDFIANFSMQHPSTRVVLDAIAAASDQIDTYEYISR